MMQAVVSASVNLLSLLEVRCGDLYRRAQQETVRVLALQYCHTLSLLASTCAATVSQPLSKHIKVRLCFYNPKKSLCFYNPIHTTISLTFLPYLQ